MTDAEVQALITALPGEQPCGADLSFDAEFLQMETAAAGEPEREYGNTLVASKGPDWRAVQQAALRLAARTRDLRLAIWVTRSSARLQGAADAMRGLQVIHGLLVQHWDHVHPELDGTDATARLNALSTLVHGDGLADLRAARLCTQRGALGLRDIELVLGHAEPLPGETVATEEGLKTALATACTEVPDLLQQLLAGHQAVLGVDAVLTEKLPAAKGLELAPLKKLMERVAQAAQLMQSADATAGGDGASANAEVVATPTARVVAMPAGAITTRDDAIKGLGRICEWIERNEPSSPAPLFIRRSQQLLQMSFIDIVRDLLPENVRQIEHFAGKSPS